MQETTVVVLYPLPDEALRRINQVEESVHVIDAAGWFDAEIRETWSEGAVKRYLGNRSSLQKSRKECDRLLASADVILGGWPYPLDVRKRAKRLRWYHQLSAGASNLAGGDLWGSNILVTTSRGAVKTLPIAEYVLACFLHFAKDLHIAYRDQRQNCFDHRIDHPTYQPLSLEDKTVCILGVGGIGRAVGRLCSGLGMRVIGTRRQKPLNEALPQGFARVEESGKMFEILGESDFVAICCQLTTQTRGLIGREAFAAMKPGTVVVNIARGAIVDEEALIAALAAGKLRGVALDVYSGELENGPDRRLWDDERVLITPHISGGRDVSQASRVELFCENLKRFLDGRPLQNVVDWERGY